MEGYIEEIGNEEEDINDPELLVLSFGNKTLPEYEAEFSVKLPAIPCSTHEILSAISNIANSYQVAYNCAARLLTICAKAKKEYAIKRNELVSAKIASLREAAGKPTKLPSKDTIEAMVVSESDELEELLDSYKKWEVIKEWFDMHVKKLTQMLNSAKDISYGVNNSDRMFSRGQV